jgi:hypothetical protein
LLCSVLKVTRQGYYAWKRRDPSARTLRDDELKAEILALYERSRDTYGAPRITARLRIDRGIRIGQKRAARLMRELGIQGAGRGGQGVRTTIPGRAPAAPDHLERDFTATRPDQKWVADVAAIEEIEQRLRAGTLPPDDGSATVEILYDSSQVPTLQAVGQRDKECLWQVREPRNWQCRATSDLAHSEASRAMCANCDIPDARIICTHLVHPQVAFLQTFGTAGMRQSVGAQCDLGHDAGDGARCRLARGMPCWRRHVDPPRPRFAIPPNPAGAVADELDYLRLVFRDRYHVDVLTVPQARSISELFGGCDSEADFHRRVAIVADLIGHLTPHAALPEEQRTHDGRPLPSLLAFERLLERDYPEIVSAVRPLRLITRARNTFPIHTNTSEAVETMRRLGITYPATDWNVAWLTTLTAFWTSLQQIRQSVQTEPINSE